MSLTEIQEKIEQFVNRRDRYQYRKNGELKNTYQAVHMKSSYGNYPLCHIRSISPNVVESPSQVDCLYCQNIMREE